MSTGVQVPFVTTRCGCCLGYLVPVAHGSAINYECPRCAPELATIRTADEWIAFHHRASRDVARRTVERSRAADAGNPEPVEAVRDSE